LFGAETEFETTNKTFSGKKGSVSLLYFVHLGYAIATSTRIQTIYKEKDGHTNRLQLGKTSPKA
jgi:hypothetical protein